MTGPDGLDEVLAEHRADLAAELTDAGIATEPYTATVLVAPCAVVVPSQPYITWPTPANDVPFGHVRVDLDVLALVVRDTPAAEAAAIDRLLVRVLRALGEHDVTRATQPGVVALGGTKFLGAVVSVHTEIKEP